MKAEVAEYEKLSMVIWYYEELSCDATDAVRWGRIAGTLRDSRYPAGTVVTTGTWVGMLPAQPGDAVSIEFTGIGRAELHL